MAKQPGLSPSATSHNLLTTMSCACNSTSWIGSGTLEGYIYTSINLQDMCILIYIYICMPHPPCVLGSFVPNPFFPLDPPLRWFPTLPPRSAEQSPFAVHPRWIHSLWLPGRCAKIFTYHLIWGFPYMGVPQNGWLNPWRILSKWMM